MKGWNEKRKRESNYSATKRMKEERKECWTCSPVLKLRLEVVMAT